ncbi:ribonuclease HI family protein [Patescibacteria group bacterium]|nr:ribonuclease HI family protein [Patescibacteria group bacterium]MBU4579928.1 ribonuclease HI family protein [Patescibacteria group bacterium]
MNDTLTIYSDGGSRGNPGPAAIGVALCASNGKTYEYGEFIGKATNNEAEYKALIMALLKAKSLKAKNVRCFLDSELAVKHLNHQYRIKDEKIIPLFIKIWNLTFDFEKITFTYIPREKNKKADALVNKILDSETKQRKLV